MFFLTGLTLALVNISLQIGVLSRVDWGLLFLALCLHLGFRQTAWVLGFFLAVGWSALAFLPLGRVVLALAVIFLAVEVLRIFVLRQNPLNLGLTFLLSKVIFIQLTGLGTLSSLNLAGQIILLYALLFLSRKLLGQFLTHEPLSFGKLN